MFAGFVALVKQTVREFIKAVKSLLTEASVAGTEEAAHMTAQAVCIAVAAAAFTFALAPGLGLQKFADALFRVAINLWNGQGRM